MAIQKVLPDPPDSRPLASWINVRRSELEGRWLAVADLADEPDVETGEEAREALREALAALGPRLAEELAAGAGLSGPDQTNR